MKPIPLTALEKLAREYGTGLESLTLFAGGQPFSDGTLYRYPWHRDHRILKILEVEQGDTNALRQAEERARLMQHLGKYGVCLPSILPSLSGPVFSTVETGNRTFFAYAMEEVSGVAYDKVHQAEKARFIEMWGAALGQTHAASLQYAIWNGIRVPNREMPLLTWREEMTFFAGWLKDDEIRSKWHTLRAKVERLPEDRTTLGFIHNDPHPYNFIMDGTKLIVLDFDVANCHFFCNDIAIALYAILMEATNQFELPIPEGVTEKFLSLFMKGYERFHRLPAGWAEHLDLFLRYRRILLLCAFSNGLEGNPPAFRSWRNRVLSDAPILPPSCIGMWKDGVPCV